MSRGTAYVSEHPHSLKDDFRTPPYLFDWVDSKFGPIHYDAACFEDGSNALAEPLRLESVWPPGSTIYSNPPWDNQSLKKWFDKGITHAQTGGTHVMLMPNKLCQTWFDSRLEKVSEVWILSGRVNFEGPFQANGGGSRTGSVILVCRPCRPYRFPTLESIRLRDLKKAVSE